MNILTKILLTIPSIVGFIYMWTFIYPKSLAWISNNVVSYEYQNLIINILILIQLGYLIYRLWHFKNIDKKKKTDWTILLIIFNIITSLIFIWKKDNEFEQLNKNTVHNN